MPEIALSDLESVFARHSDLKAMRSIRQACGATAIIVASLLLAVGVAYLVANLCFWNGLIWLLDPGKYLMHLVLCPAAALLIGYWFRKVHSDIISAPAARTRTLHITVATVTLVSCATAWGNIGVYGDGSVGTIVYPTDLCVTSVDNEPSYSDTGLAYLAEQKAAAELLHKELLGKIWPKGFHAGESLPHVHNKASEWYQSICQAKKGRNHVMAGEVALAVYDVCRKKVQGDVSGVAVLGILSITGIMGMTLNMIGVSMCILLLAVCIRHASLRGTIRSAEDSARPGAQPLVRSKERASLIALFVCTVVLAVWLPCIMITDHFVGFDTAVSASEFGLPLALAATFAVATLLVTTLDDKTTAKVWKAGALLIPVIISSVTALTWPHRQSAGIQFGLLIVIIVVGAVFVPILLRWVMKTNLSKVSA